MTGYLDTSLLVTLLANEPGTLRAQAWLRENAGRSFSISDWTLTEFSAALSIKARIGSIDARSHARVLQAMDDMKSESLAVIAVVRADFRRAARLADRYETGLRAGDALHLAIAADRGLKICTRDAGLARAAAALGCDHELV